MGMHRRIAIVAALEREVKSAIRLWRAEERQHEGRTFKFYEGEQAVLICGGIGPEPARRATQAVIAFYSPSIVLSVGFAGALTPDLKVGDIFTPARIINLADGSKVETGDGHGTLLSLGYVANKEEKLKLAKAYGAQAVDMEAAAVARGAEAQGIGFRAVKAISDGVDFSMPPMKGAIDSAGNLHTGSFLFSAFLRPWTWATVFRLARNSSSAAKTLTNYLNQYNQGAEILNETATPVHPIGKT